MSISIKNKNQIEGIKAASEIAATVLDEMVQAVEPGMTTYDLDQIGKQHISQLGAESACYNYRVGNRYFPAYTCISINEEVVHGIGSMNRAIEAGDIVSLDVVVRYQGYIGDNARTVGVGDITVEKQFLIEATEQALYQAIEKAAPGNRLGDISSAVQSSIESKDLSIVRDFVGHGVGCEMHEEPQIPNFGRPNTGPVLKEGMTLAIEPMVNLGSPRVEMLADGWTAVSYDRKPSAHFEHTVLVGSNGPEILTFLKK